MTVFDTNWVDLTGLRTCRECRQELSADAFYPSELTICRVCKKRAGRAYAHSSRGRQLVRTHRTNRRAAEDIPRGPGTTLADIEAVLDLRDTIRRLVDTDARKASGQ